MIQKILMTTMTAALLAWPKPDLVAAQGHNQIRTPVVVELFTSEGCSDCPPVEALATRLARTQPISGAEVLVLAEHVDYFNSARWTDRFSSAAFTARQEGYVSRFRLSSAYTPQMVVDGRAEFVGSDEDRANQTIAAAAQAPHAQVMLTRVGNALHIHIENLPASYDPKDVLLAVTESQLRVPIKGGENAGHILIHNDVVRSLRVIGSASGAICDTSVQIAPREQRESQNTQMIVFVQKRMSRQILGASVLGL